MEKPSDIGSLAAGPLAPLFRDPAIPAAMRDAEAVAAAAALSDVFAGLDGAFADAALSAISGLHPELRVPGALLFMSARGAFWRASPGARRIPGYVPAPSGSWDFPFMAGFSDPAKLAELLGDFSWRAAAAALPPRARAHEESLAFLSRLPAISATYEANVAGSAYVSQGTIRAADGVDRFSSLAGRFSPDRAKPEDAEFIEAGEELVREFGLNSCWAVDIAARAKRGGKAVREFLEEVRAPARAFAKSLTDAGCRDPLGVLFELGAARCARIATASGLSGDHIYRLFHSGEREWTRPDGAKAEEDDTDPYARMFLQSALGSNPHVPPEHLSAVAGAWRAAGEGRYGLVRARCLATDARFCAEFVDGCSRTPPSLRVPYLAALMRAWAADGRADGAYAGRVADRRTRGAPENPDAGAEVSEWTRGQGRAVHAAAMKLREIDAGFLFAHGERVVTLPYFSLSAGPDRAVNEAAAENFGRDGKPLDPSALARAALAEISDPYVGITDAPDVTLDAIVKSVSSALAAAGFENVPRGDVFAAAKSVGMATGDDAGKFLRLLEKYVKFGGAVSWAEPRRWDWDPEGAAETLYRGFREKGPADAADMEARRKAWAPAYRDPDWVVKLREAVAGGPVAARTWEAPEEWEAPPVHPAVLEVVKMAVRLGAARKNMRTEALAILGPVGRKLAS